MKEQYKADLDKLEALREQALFGPEEKREEAQRAYEELRAQLLPTEECGSPLTDSLKD